MPKLLSLIGFWPFWYSRSIVSASLRSAQADIPRTSCAVSRFFHAQKRPPIWRPLLCMKNHEMVQRKATSRVRFARFYERCKSAPNWLLGACSRADTFECRLIARQRDSRRSRIPLRLLRPARSMTPPLRSSRRKSPKKFSTTYSCNS